MPDRAVARRKALVKAVTTPRAKVVRALRPSATAALMALSYRSAVVRSTGSPVV